MTDEMLIHAIIGHIKSEPGDIEGYRDLFNACRRSEIYGSVEVSHSGARWLKGAIERNSRQVGDSQGLYDVWRKVLLFTAIWDFDSYLLYLEIDRKKEERFYQPRRKILRPLVEAMQDLEDGRLDELFLSMPPRVGKTTILMFFSTWVLGKDGERSNLYSAYSDLITHAFYNGVLETINDPVTYKWKEIFPGSSVAGQNAQEETLNIDRKKRYPSLTCRSLYGTLNGACDCNGILMADDLIGGIEEALNKDRLVAAWGKVDNNLIPRAKEMAKILWCGTRWSIADPIGMRLDLLENDPQFENRKFRVITLPALNDDDESNFDYEFGVGFSTEYYRQRRASFERNNDMASWNAQYMGKPIEREGVLFTPDEFTYYNGELPEGEPDRIFMAVDPAFGGGDFVAAPICCQYGERLFVHDVVFDNGDKKVTQPLLANAIEKHRIQAVQFEATKATESYASEVEALLKEKGIRVNITTKAAPTTMAKFQRIFDKAPDIREIMIFRESGKRDKPYRLFMDQVFSYKIMGKNKHDDAPDSLSMAIDMIQMPSRKVQIFRRPI